MGQGYWLVLKLILQSDFTINSIEIIAEESFVQDFSSVLLHQA